MPLFAEKGIHTMRTRKRTLQVYLNETEYEKLNALCKTSGLPRSTVIRKLITGTEIKQRVNADFMSLQHEIYRIGINLNQIAIKANQMQLNSADLQEANALMKQIERTLADWRRYWAW